MNANLHLHLPCFSSPASLFFSLDLSSSTWRVHYLYIVVRSSRTNCSNADKTRKNCRRTLTSTIGVSGVPMMDPSWPIQANITINEGQAEVTNPLTGTTRQCHKFCAPLTEIGSPCYCEGINRKGSVHAGARVHQPNCASSRIGGVRRWARFPFPFPFPFHPVWSGCTLHDHCRLGPVRHQHACRDLCQTRPGHTNMRRATRCDVAASKATDPCRAHPQQSQ